MNDELLKEFAEIVGPEGITGDASRADHLEKAFQQLVVHTINAFRDAVVAV